MEEKNTSHNRQISRRKLADSGKWLEEKKKKKSHKIGCDRMFMLKSEDVTSSFLDILLFKICLLNKGAFKHVF